MVASVSARGYAATRLDDLVELSGVSTASFYRLFPSKDACFLAATEELLRTALAVTDSGSDGTWEERIRRAFVGFARLVATQPAAARMVLIDSFAAGPEVRNAIDRAVDELQRRAIALVHESRERTEMPDAVPTAIVGAVQELARDRVRRGRANAIPALMEVVANVALSYRPPAEPLTYTGRLPRPLPETLEVPGSAERAIRALAVVAAERGYREVTVEEIVKRASMSPTTFYADFADKREAMLAAIDSAGAQMVAATLPAFRRNADWQAALRTAFTDLLAYLASRPALARLIFLEAYAAGPEALQRRAEALEPLTALLWPGNSRADEESGMVTEVVWAAVFAMIQHQIRESGAHTLPALGPTLTFIALGPFVGAEKASASAFGRRRDRTVGEAEALRAFYEEPLANKVVTALTLQPATAAEIAEKLDIAPAEVNRLFTVMIDSEMVESVDHRPGDDPIDDRYRWLLRSFPGNILSIAEHKKVAAYIAANLDEELRHAFEADTVTLRPEHVLVRMPAQLDEKGWREISALLERAMDETIKLIEDSHDRLAETAETPIRATAGLLFFEVPDLARWPQRDGRHGE